MAVRKKAAAKNRKAKAAPALKNTKQKAPKAQAPKAKKAKPAKTVARGQALMKKSAPIGNFSNSPIVEKQSKAQIYAEIAEMTGLSKNDVKHMFSALKNVAERHLKGKGSGEFVIPELGVKVRRIHKPATKARMGRNPFTGEDIQIPAKPARKSVKATALKALKALAAS